VTTGDPPPRPRPDPGEQLRLEPGEVHVWHADLDSTPWPPATLARSLAPGEWCRADRFRSRGHRQRFIAGRGMLRHLLAAYLGAQPGDLELRSGAGGKPEVAIPPGGPSVRFNCSHSQGRAVYGVTLRRRIGVDVEVVRPVPEAVAIAERWFSPPERAQLLASPPGRRSEAFLRTWTVKEAYLKARGEGLAADASGVDGSALPPAWWSSCLEPLSGCAGCVGAVVAEGHALRLRCWSAEAPPGSSW
jgi:4'-phosphopantetheinyl transferase